MTTKYLREKFGLTQKQLSDFFDIPLRTVQNWDSRNCCPSYVYNMMTFMLYHIMSSSLVSELNSHENFFVPM